MRWTLKRVRLNGKKAFGEHPELSQRGISQTGTENFGGSIVTAGGLVLITATSDQKFRAFSFFLKSQGSFHSSFRYIGNR